MRARILLPLFLLTLVAYAGLLLPGGEFLDFDDRHYVQLNQKVSAGLTWAGLRWAAGITREVSNWHPLTWVSHMLDAQLFGQHPAGHHLSSVLLHLGNGALLLRFLLRLGWEGPRLWILCGIFLLHPLQVESVAWISERKNVLSMGFALLALSAYLDYGRRPRAAGYAWVTLWLTLGLLAKPMVVTLPCVFLLLDAHPLSRLRPARAWPYLEKLPWLLLCAGCSALTVMAQSAAGIRSLAQVPFWGRVGNALYAYAFYIGKMLWPQGLYPLYRHPQRWPLWVVVLSLLLLCAISAVLLWRRRPLPLVGWCWFLGTLVPVIGLVQVGDQFAADRYTYLPAVGFWIALLGSLPESLWARVAASRLCAPVLVIGAIALAALTLPLSLIWRTTLSFNQHLVRSDPQSPIAHAGVGDALIEKGRCAEAIAPLEAALRLSPTYADAHVSLATCLGQLGRTEDALAHLGQALSLRPGVAQAQAVLEDTLRASPLPAAAQGRATRLLGERLMQRGVYGPALHCFQRAVEIAPADLEARRAMLSMAGRMGDHETAAAHLLAVLAQRPDDTEVRRRLERELRGVEKGGGRRLPPRYQARLDRPAAYEAVGGALLRAGQREEAAAAFRAALALEPGRKGAQEGLARSAP